jgi:hypothetical protein
MKFSESSARGSHTETCGQMDMVKLTDAFPDYANAPKESELPNQLRRFLVCLFVCFLGVTTHCGCIFHSPVAGFSVLVIRGFLITHNAAPQSVGLLWTSDQSVTETSTWQHTTLNDRHPCPPVGFEPTISAGERPKTYALDRMATAGGYTKSNESANWESFRSSILQHGVAPRHHFAVVSK